MQDDGRSLLWHSKLATTCNGNESVAVRRLRLRDWMRTWKTQLMATKGSESAAHPEALTAPAFLCSADDHSAHVSWTSETETRAPRKVEDVSRLHALQRRPALTGTMRLYTSAARDTPLHGARDTSQRICVCSARSSMVSDASSRYCPCVSRSAT